MSDGSLVTSFPIPKEILSKDEQVIYDSVPEAERPMRYKWWSMHDILKYFKSGFLPLENDANFFKFKIDLTNPELEENKFRDPAVNDNLNRSMSNLATVTTAISQKFIEAQAAAAKANLETALSNNRPRGGGFTVDPAATIEEAFSGKKLQDECMNDLLADVFNSRQRIFILDKELPLYQAKTLDELKASEANLEAEEAKAKAPATVGGGRGRRKTRKSGKKRGRKSRKLLPFKKR